MRALVLVAGVRFVVMSLVLHEGTQVSIRNLGKSTTIFQAAFHPGSERWFPIPLPHTVVNQLVTQPTPDRGLARRAFRCTLRCLDPTVVAVSAGDRCG